jgi:hypothetical protein
MYPSGALDILTQVAATSSVSPHVCQFSPQRAAKCVWLLNGVQRPL